MTSGTMEIQSFGLLWLLTSVHIVRTYATSVATKRTPAPTFALIIQRPRIAGGILTIHLDNKIQLLRCTKNDVDKNLIRLRYGPSGKHLVMRATNATEREMWCAELRASVATPKPASTRVSVKPQTSDVQREQETSNRVASTARTLPSHSLDALKRLADGYENLALQWTQVAAETREFNSQIASLRPIRIDAEGSNTVGCAA